MGAALAALCLPSTAHAEGFALNKFEPAERGSRWFLLDSLDLSGHLKPAVGLILDYQYQPLAIKSARTDDVKEALVGHVVTMHAGANVVLWDRVRIGGNLPILFYNEGTTARAGGVTYFAPVDQQGVGDLRLGADLRLFGTKDSPITMAFGGQIWLPTGSPASYTGDGAVRGGPRLLAAGKIGPFVYAANVGAVFRDPKVGVFAKTPIDHDLTYGASVGLLLDNRITVGPEVFGSTVLGDDFFARRTTPLEILGGAHTDIAYGLKAGIGAGTALLPGFGAPQIRVLGSIEWVMPEKAAPVAPPPPTDTDGDGIPDSADACPDSYGVKTSDPRTNGCDDRDKDGIADPLDACPSDPGVANDDPKKNGCPSDKDADGIVDSNDACPDVAGIPSDNPKLNGCPDPDRDKDGIPNDVDACPDDPGPAHPNPKRNGCAVAFIHGTEIRIKENVSFQIGSFVLATDKGTVEVLSAVKEILTAHPEITKVRVEGHTDNRGIAAWNKKLSDARAQTVVNWLVRKGIAKTRLTAVGWGQERPIVENDTDQGRALNRRVEFHIESPEAAQPASEPAK